MKTANQSFHFGSWCCITIPTLEINASVVQEIVSGQTFIDILTFDCDLDLEHSDPMLFHPALRYMTMYDQTQIDCKRVSSSEDLVETVIFWLYNPCCDLDLEQANHFFPVWHSDSIIRYDTEFGSKKLNGSGDILRTNICWEFKPSLWPWPWARRFNSSQNNLTYNDVP